MPHSITTLQPPQSSPPAKQPSRMVIEIMWDAESVDVGDWLFDLQSEIAHGLAEREGVIATFSETGRDGSSFAETATEFAERCREYAFEEALAFEEAPAIFNEDTNPNQTDDGLDMLRRYVDAQTTSRQTP